MALSGYRIMWAFVMFDLPVVTKAEKRRARKFHDYLLDEGFDMKQFSVYYRFYESRAKADAASKRISAKIPERGMVSILSVTDKQFGQMVNFMGKVPTKNDQKPDQLALF
ncbi:CRISPR-associated endonuclease Cas2 [Thalassospira sp. MCCC 1A01428]|jgi:CRISPR-associated protein Cas2|uniref:CRISPR-associated endonuclease Cas2 n=1 Tax=Thalassospira sp. MCCC 1A01428 TaxID=1470575 RepID=UPI000A1D7726|nr:CRISPR-associated endonuclease Cas2 [Thalassospira sp. MCCC 1A01428]OSQ43228.1 CRISPR-associated protein Cas2 [Thalassospira sp. MCCC 1A01428]|tara:strand:- start:1504 stop:1833 length:330 start_codon:yes stop_codon:yes gene_type:complete